MTIYYNAQDRKPLVKAISKFTGADAVYMRTPTYAYQIDYFTVTREGNLEFDDRADSEEIEGLLEFLACIHITAPFHLSVHFFDGHTFDTQWENKRKMPRHSEERKQHMRKVMIEKWRERHGKSNDYSGNDQSVHSCTD